MIISVTSLKGGVGKSTIAQNLAVCFAHSGYKVCIADADTNQSSVRWSGLRDEGKPSVLVSGLPDGKELAKNVKILNESYELIIIDGTPSLSPTASKILLLADMVIIPVLPSALDLWATQQFLERYEEACAQKDAPIPAYFLLNQHDERTTLSKEAEEALSNFEELGIKTLKSTIKNRVAYKRAVMEGLGVFEFGDAKAKEEFAAVCNEILANL